MSIEVIGAGFGRTGTMSLKRALETLGFDPCHHMMKVTQNQMDFQAASTIYSKSLGLIRTALSKSA